MKLRKIDPKFRTHFLSIPLATTKARPQVQECLDRLRNDKSTAALPSPAWHSVDRIGIHLGSLRLSGSDELSTACEILKKFDAPSILGTGSRDGPSITLKGLRSGYFGTPSVFTRRLYFDIMNPRPVQMLGKELYKVFHSHGLLLKQYPSKDSIEYTHHPAKIMDTRPLTSDESPGRELGFQVEKRLIYRPVFDARQVFAAHGDTLWAENLALESICLREITGLKDRVKDGKVFGQGYEDIFRVSLSDPAASGYGQNDPETEYVRSSKIHHSEKVKTPFVISSDPGALQTPELRRYIEMEFQK